jgi:serine O-acetyltransferase
MISASEPDWSREVPHRWWDPGYRLLRAIRKYQAASGRFARKYWALQHRFWSTVTQSEIHLTQKIGGGLRLPHPTGIILHQDAVLGPNCQLFHQVTLGLVEDRPGAPVLGGHVDVGSGARILGPVTIGDHARVGANAVVLQDVPEGATAVGIPARIIPPKAERAVS